MSETRDKRRRTDLDFFVLALIDSGVATPYELQKVAGLSPGATIPVLRRLVAKGLAVQGEAGPRGRTDFKVTAEGVRSLKSNWRKLIDQGPSGDLDADLRVALLALWGGGDRRLAAGFLRQAARQRLESLGQVEEPDQPSSAPALARWYRQMRASSARELIKGESAALLSMATALPRRQAAAKKQARKKTVP